MSEHKYAKLQTPLGGVVLVATSANHVCIRTGDGDGDADPITVNRVPYRASVHITKWKNGAWNLGNESETRDWCRERDAVYLDRADRFDNRGASESAKKRAVPVLVECARHYLKEHPELLHFADVSSVESELGSVRREIAELENKLAAAKKRLAALVWRQTELNAETVLTYASVERELQRNATATAAAGVSVSDNEFAALVERKLTGAA